MREYETIYILRPELGGEAVDTFNAKMKETIGQTQGKVIRLSNWGKKKLAYRLKKCTRGTYVHILFLGEGPTVMETERMLKISDNVIRYLTVMLQDNVDPAQRQVEIDVRLRGDAEDDAHVAATPASAAVAQAPASAQAAEIADEEAMQADSPNE